MFKLKIVIRDDKDQIIHEKIDEFRRYSHAESEAIRLYKKLGGKKWDIKTVNQ